MNLDQHPTYPNPTIVEAVCEICFQLDTESRWDVKRSGDLLPSLEPLFTDFEISARPKLDVQQTADGGISHTILPDNLAYQFKDEEGSRRLQLSNASFVYNVVGAYPGWPDVLAEVLNYWKIVSGAIGAEAVSKVGLRYINKISTSVEKPTISDWLISNDFLAPALVESKGGFLLRQETKPTEEDKCILTIGMGPADPEDGCSSIVFDIDRIVSAEIKLDDIQSVLESLHVDVSKIFEQSKSENLDLLLKQET